MHKNKWLQTTPIEISTWALGLSGYSSAFAVMLSNWDVNKTLSLIPKMIIMPIVLFLIILVIIRNIYNKNNFKEEITKTSIAAIVPTMSMSLVSFGCYFSSFDDITNASHTAHMVIDSISAVMIYIGTAFHFGWLAYFIYIAIKTKSNILSKSLSSWAVPFIGMCITCTCCGDIDRQIVPLLFEEILFWFGLVNFIWLYPCLLYRHIKHKLVISQLNSAAIFAAPIGLLLSSFFSVFTPNLSTTLDTIKIYGYDFINVFVCIFMVMSTLAFIFLLVWLYFAHKNHNYSIVAFSFPVAANTLAIGLLTKLAKYKINNIIFNDMYSFLKIYNLIAIILMSAIFIYLAVVFVKYYVHNLKRYDKSMSEHKQQKQLINNKLNEIQK